MFSEQRVQLCEGHHPEQDSGSAGLHLVPPHLVHEHLHVHVHALHLEELIQIIDIRSRPFICIQGRSRSNHFP